MKQNRETGGGRGPAPEKGSLLTPGVMRLTTLAGVGVLIYMSFASTSELRKFQAGLGDRLNQIENRVTQMSAKIDASARAAAPQRQDPDPNKVVNVKIDGAPFEGPKNAPVTIAEFSDFQ